MSKARLLQDYLIPGSTENENILITDYWLEFVSATDGYELAPVIRFSETDIREKVRDFQQQVNAVVKNHENLRHALSKELFAPVPAVSSCALKGMPMQPPWHARPVPPQTPPDEESEEELDAEEESGYGSNQDVRMQATNALGTLLIKLLGK